jgi:hypothetical protein
MSRRRIDLALMLIIRRAEREATLPGRLHSAEPDTATVSHQERPAADPDAPRPH